MAPPVPIPNTEVKHFSADDTEGATLCGKYATARELIYTPSLMGSAVNLIMWSQGGGNGEPI